MEEYKIAVENFAKNGENFEFTNKGKEHAAIVVTNMIKYAQDEVLLYSGSLNHEVTDNKELLNALDTFIRTGHKLRIILDTMPEENQRSEILKLVLKLQHNEGTNVIIRIDEANEFVNLVAETFQTGNIYHFMVVDEKSYRFETDIENYKAICNFNDREIATQLKTIFTYFLSE